MNAIHGERFQPPQPARTSYGAAFLWKGAKVQISCVAVSHRADGRPSNVRVEPLLT